MDLCLFLVFAGVCMGLIFWGLRRPDGIYQFPFLAGVVFSGFILVQMAALLNSHLLPAGGLRPTLLMAILCSAMCYLGYVWKPGPIRALAWKIDPKRLLQVGVFYFAVGAAAFVLFERTSPDFNELGGMTGEGVALLFITDLMPIAFAIGTLSFARGKSITGMLIMIGSLLAYVDRIIVSGRRSPTAEMLLILGLAFWFGTRKSMPRVIVVTVGVVGVILFYSIADFRNLNKVFTEETDSQSVVDRVASKEWWRALLTIKFAENIHAVMESENSEMANAAQIILTTMAAGDYDYGAFQYDNLVFRFFPGQILGRGTKESLYLITAQGLNPALSLKQTAFEGSGDTFVIGTTITGLADSFHSFGFFGCLAFFFVAWFMRKLYEGAIQRQPASELLYMLTILSALHTIPHHTGYLPARLVFVAVFVLPALWYARPHGTQTDGAPLGPKRSLPSPPIEKVGTL